MLQLPAASSIELAVDRHPAVDDGLFHVSTGIEESSKPQELPEANDLAGDRDVLNRTGSLGPDAAEVREPVDARTVDDDGLVECLVFDLQVKLAGLG